MYAPIDVTHAEEYTTEHITEKAITLTDQTVINVPTEDIVVEAVISKQIGLTEKPVLTSTEEKLTKVVSEKPNE